MKLTVVGCAPAYATKPGQASSCYLVEHGDTSVVLDLGQGSFADLWRYRDPDRVSAIVISHLHGDHCVDLIPLRHFIKFERAGRGPALYGPPDLRSRFGAFQVDPEFFADLGGGQLEEGTFRVGDLDIEARRVTHIPDSFAFRVAPAGVSGPGLVYSGDCGVAEDLLPLVRPGDTLLCEAGFGLTRDAPGIHLTAEEAASVAERGAADTLILTHVHNRFNRAEVLEAARSNTSADVEFADPGTNADIT
jgi:ribonuclease BN (tRNA processing enzyme)